MFSLTLCGSTVRNASRVLVVQNGAIVEQGTHDELMATGGIYRKLGTYRMLPVLLREAVSSLLSEAIIYCF